MTNSFLKHKYNNKKIKIKKVVVEQFHVFLKLFSTSCIKKTDSLISDFVLRPATNNVGNIKIIICLYSMKIKMNLILI